MTLHFSLVRTPFKTVEHYRITKWLSLIVISYRLVSYKELVNPLPGLVNGDLRELLDHAGRAPERGVWKGLFPLPRPLHVLEIGRHDLDRSSFGPFQEGRGAWRTGPSSSRALRSFSSSSTGLWSHSEPSESRTTAILPPTSMPFHTKGRSATQSPGKARSTSPLSLLHVFARRATQARTATAEAEKGFQ